MPCLKRSASKSGIIYSFGVGRRDNLVYSFFGVHFFAYVGRRKEIFKKRRSVHAAPTFGRQCPALLASTQISSMHYLHPDFYNNDGRVRTYICIRNPCPPYASYSAVNEVNNYWRRRLPRSSTQQNFTTNTRSQINRAIRGWGQNSRVGSGRVGQG